MDAAEFLAKRQAAGLSIAAVARLTGKSRAHVSRVETGQSAASEKYEHGFLAALALQAGETLSSELVKYPAAYARKLIAESGSVLDDVLRHLEDQERRRESELKQLKAIMSKLGRQIELLVGEPTLEATHEFDPRVANDDELGRVNSFICSVMVELVVDHNFHLLEDDLISNYLGQWAQIVGREARKARNRATLARFSID